MVPNEHEASPRPPAGSGFCGFYGEEDREALRVAVADVLNGADPLAFVNRFTTAPLTETDPLPEYWTRRICTLSMLLREIGEEIKRSPNGASALAIAVHNLGG